MILASPNGLLCACKLIRETPKAWVVSYVGEGKKEVRVSKDSGRKMFDRVSDAEHWIINGSAS